MGFKHCGFQSFSTPTHCNGATIFVCTYVCSYIHGVHVCTCTLIQPPHCGFAPCLEWLFVCNLSLSLSPSPSPSPPLPPLPLPSPPLPSPPQSTALALPTKDKVSVSGSCSHNISMLHLEWSNNTNFSATLIFATVRSDVCLDPKQGPSVLSVTAYWWRCRRFPHALAGPVLLCIISYPASL